MQESLQKTKNYSLFKIINGNRTLDSKHVNNLIESIKKSNLLALRPILVDKDFYVVDGQHRLEAAKVLDLDIYYFQIKNENHSEMVILNQNNKNWKLEDFLIFHAIKHNNPNYLKIIQVNNKYGWSLSEFFLYSSVNMRKNSIRKAFEAGDFIFETSDEYLDDVFSKWKTLSDFINEKKLDGSECVNNIIFRSAFLIFHSSKSIKIEQFWEKFRSHPTLFFRCRNRDEFLDMFLKIYNYGVNYKIEKGMI